MLCRVRLHGGASVGVAAVFGFRFRAVIIPRPSIPTYLKMYHSAVFYDGV